MGSNPMPDALLHLDCTLLFPDSSLPFSDKEGAPLLNFDLDSDAAQLLGLQNGKESIVSSTGTWFGQLPEFC